MAAVADVVAHKTTTLKCLLIDSYYTMLKKMQKGYQMGDRTDNIMAMQSLIFFDTYDVDTNKTLDILDTYLVKFK